MVCADDLVEFHLLVQHMYIFLGAQSRDLTGVIACEELCDRLPGYRFKTKLQTSFGCGQVPPLHLYRVV
jgi:hypothetical protein